MTSAPDAVRRSPRGRARTGRAAQAAPAGPIVPTAVRVPTRVSVPTGVTAMLLALLLLVVTPGCSRVRRHFFGGSAPTRRGTLTIAPPSGQVGTVFEFTAAGFRSGEPMTFEIDIPNRRPFVGPSHVAGPDGTVTSKYTPQTGDPAGTYRVKAVGSRGTRADGVLMVQGSTTTTP